jgi:hypothetical protein
MPSLLTPFFEKKNASYSVPSLVAARPMRRRRGSRFGTVPLVPSGFAETTSPALLWPKRVTTSLPVVLRVGGAAVSRAAAGAVNPGELRGCLSYVAPFADVEKAL